MKLDITGVITRIGETQSFGANGFLKREVVIETEGQYKQPIALEFIQNNVDLIDPYTEGETIIASVNIKGRYYNEKVYNSFQVWRVQRVPLQPGNQETPQPNPLPNEPVMPEKDEAIPGGESTHHNQVNEEDDLPF